MSLTCGWLSWLSRLSASDSTERQTLGCVLVCRQLAASIRKLLGSCLRSAGLQPSCLVSSCRLEHSSLSLCWCCKLVCPLAASAAELREFASAPLEVLSLPYKPVEQVGSESNRASASSQR